jgi:hypothetical protein
MENETINPRAETYKHIRRVNELTLGMAKLLIDRAVLHDDSKLMPPEAELFEGSTHKLRGLAYGTDEYRAALREIKPAVDHHQQNNRHHPEFFGRPLCAQCGCDGRKDQCTCGGPRDADLRGMNLIDLLEMICDWKAAGERHATGDIVKSIEQNQSRFHYSDELKQVFLNTVPLLSASVNPSHSV